MHRPLERLLDSKCRALFFTGKGGVGKTSLACAVAIGLADRGERVLLVSTDPASNLDEVLDTPLGSAPVPVPGVPGLRGLNIDPEAAARAYRERVVGPYRGVLPDEAVASIEEQLSGACTVEIAAFDEFVALLADPEATRGFDRVVFDTAPTGHTLRLLELPAAWSQFLETNVGGTSCLGPLSGLQAQQRLYKAARQALGDPTQTTLVLVARPNRASLREAERTRTELEALGVENLQLVLNGVFRARRRDDRVAASLESAGRAALSKMPQGLSTLPRIELPLVPFPLLGPPALRAFGAGTPAPDPAASTDAAAPPPDDGAATSRDLASLVEALSTQSNGVIMVMGKGGVGKTTVAAAVAVALARSGRPVTLTTTDPAAHVAWAVTESLPCLRVERIDPEAETARYREHVLASAGAQLDAQGRALLEEELRSPCTEEVAVFQAFAETVARAESGIVVVDTAPTGHTLLLLDSAEAYHREVLRRASDAPEAVRRLLPRLRDPDYTRILLVTLPEATPIHEAQQLQQDLRRAGIQPYAWVVNQSLSPLPIADPLLAARRALEAPRLAELSAHAPALYLLPWDFEAAA